MKTKITILVLTFGMSFALCFMNDADAADTVISVPSECVMVQLKCPELKDGKCAKATLQFKGDCALEIENPGEIKRTESNPSDKDAE